MKKIGILGGLSPESTLLYYRTIVEEYRRRFGDDYYPVVIIYSVCFGKFKYYMSNQMPEKAVGLLVEGIKSLERAGADFAVIAANTPHIFYEKIVEKSVIPVISIIDAIEGELKGKGVSRTGLLGTKTLLKSGLYQRELGKRGYVVLVPDEKEMDEVNHIIFSELTQGLTLSSSREKVLKIIDKMVEKGAESVILGCTELPLLFQEYTGKHSGIFIDSARAHAITALDYSLGKPLSVYHGE
jgi:aspartate racemase